MLCVGCEYFREVEEATGECHAHPPKDPTRDGRYTAYPRVWPGEVACAEFKARPASAETVPVTVGTSSVRVAPASPRRSLVVANDSGAVVYVKYGPGASSASWTHRLAPNGEITIPGSEWDGEVHAARGTGTSVVLVTTVFS